MSGTVLLVIIVVLGLWALMAYNRLVRLSQQSTEALSDIDVQAKRRYDLIPNLVETVKGYAAHEQGTFQKVIEARNTAMQNASGDFAAKAGAENALSGTLKSLFALSENYPDLKANANFLALQQELSDTENKMQAARRFYNGTVRDLNIAIDTAPSNMIANMFHFVKKEYFDLPSDSVENNPVQVKF